MIYKLLIDLNKQQLSLLQNEQAYKVYSISSGANGIGEEQGSGKTPRGRHCICAKIGKEMPINTVFRHRKPTGELYTEELCNKYSERDWILTRILWLQGLEVGKNRLGNVDTFERFIYIHGTPDSTPIGQPGSKGCIRMRNADIIELFGLVNIGTEVYLQD